MAKIVPITWKIDFIFDNRSEKKEIISAWDETVEKTDDVIKGLIGATPRFENDREFLPLQAADLWAWWVREWYEEEESEAPDRLRNFDVGSWKGNKRSFIAIMATEEQICKRIKSIAIESALEQDPIGFNLPYELP